MKVLFRFDAGAELLARVQTLATDGIEIVCAPESSDAQYEQALPDAEVIWHVLKPIDAGQIARAPRLRLIQKIGVGVNTIALDACKARGIAVCNMPGTNTRAVAEMALLLMLSCLRRINLLDKGVRTPGGWGEGWRLQGQLGELGGRTVGLVGYGGVAKLLEVMLVAMGATVIHSSRSGGVPLDELLAAADIVSLHAPLTPETDRFIDPRKMKRGAIFINTARGGLVDQEALVECLNNGHLAAAGLDVFAEEPIAPDAPLLTCPNLVCAPHVAWLTRETWERSLRVAVENVRRMAAGRNLLHHVV